MSGSSKKLRFSCSSSSRPAQLPLKVAVAKECESMPCPISVQVGLWHISAFLHVISCYNISAGPGCARGARKGKRATPTTATISQQQQQPRQCWQGGGAKVHSGKGDPEGTLDLGTNHHWRRNPPFSGIVFRCGKGYFLEACSSTSCALQLHQAQQQQQPRRLQQQQQVPKSSVPSGSLFLLLLHRFPHMLYR